MNLQKIFTKIKKTPLKLNHGIATLLAIIIFRFTIDSLLFNGGGGDSFFMMQRCFHELLFFTIIYILFINILSKAWKFSVNQTKTLLLWGYFLMIAPPLLIDHLIFGNDSPLSFYEFASLAGLWEGFLTFFGKDPNIGIVYGARFTTFLILFFIFVITYSLQKSIIWKKILYALKWTFISYFTFFIIYTFPSWIVIVQQSFFKNIFTINDMDIARIFFAPTHILSLNTDNIATAFNIRLNILYLITFLIIFFYSIKKYYSKKMSSFLKNVRPPQLTYHIIILATGTGLGLLFADKNNPDTITNVGINWQYYFDFFGTLAWIIILLAVSFAWLSSVIVNDIFDQKIDQISNPKRPLILNKFSIKEYRILGLSFFLASLFFSATINSKITFLLLAYHSLSWIYSAWPLRLKRFAFLSTFISSLAILLILFSGFILVSPTQSLIELPITIIWLFIISFTLSLPIKDLKDIDGDQQDNVKTIPVLFGEYWGKIIISSGIFISYLLSVFFIHEFRLLWWAIFFGGISFWLISLSTKKSKLNYSNIIWPILLLSSIYGLIFIKLVFL